MDGVNVTGIASVNGSDLNKFSVEFIVCFFDIIFFSNIMKCLFLQI